MKSVIVFGFRFSVERCKRFSVLSSCPDGGMEEVGRFDSLKAADKGLRASLGAKAAAQPGLTITGVILDVQTGDEVGYLEAFDGLETVRVTVVSGVIGNRRV